MSNLLNNLTGAVRSLAKAPLPTGLAIAALALGVGANSVIFSAVKGVLSGLGKASGLKRLTPQYPLGRLEGRDLLRHRFE